MARYLRRLSLIVCSFWIGCALQREYTMGQPLKCLFQNDLQKCPVEKSLFHRRPFPSISHVSERSCLYGLTFHSDSDTIGLNAVFGCVDIDTRHCTCSLRLPWNSRRS